MNPRKVLICGDWHGDLRAAKAAIHAAKVGGADAIIQVGDLTWNWPRTHPKEFDQPLEEELSKAGLVMVWADGNHDNHEALRALPVGEDGLAECSPSLFYSPRANRWEWNGVTFATVGGAYSIDRDILTTGIDVWPDLEEVTMGDVYTLGSDRVDILITHEVPAGVPLSKRLRLPGHIERASYRSRELLRQAVDLTRPVYVFSGHWHQRRSETIAHPDDAETACEVLDMNGTAGNAVFLDLDTMELSEPEPGWHQWTRKADKKRRAAEARSVYRSAQDA